MSRWPSRQVRGERRGNDPCSCWKRGTLIRTAWFWNPLDLPPHCFQHEHYGFSAGNCRYCNRNEVVETAVLHQFTPRATPQVRRSSVAGIAGTLPKVRFESREGL